MNTHSVHLKNQNFVLHPSGSLFWSQKRMLLISDVHLGKVSHFRKFGAAVPQKAVQKNFDLMDEVIDYFQPESVVFMGDLFHSSLNSEWQIFEKWVSNNTRKIILVAGNHDIISPIKYEDLGVQVVLEIESDGFLLTHHPEERGGLFNFCGHIHPAVRLSGLGRQSVRLRCFFKTNAQMVLPAFGEFTGSHTVVAEKNCEIYALLGDTVLVVPFKETGRKRRF